MYKGLGYNPTTVNFKQTRNDSNSSASGMLRGRGNVREGRGNAFEIKLIELWLRKRQRKGFYPSCSLRWWRMRAECTAGAHEDPTTCDLDKISAIGLSHKVCAEE